MNFFDIPIRVKALHQKETNLEPGIHSDTFNQVNRVKLVYIIEGKGVIEVNDHGYDIKEHHLYVLTDSSKVVVKNTSYFRSIWVNVSLFILYRIKLFDILENKVMYRVKEPRRYLQLFYDLLKSKETDKKSSLRRMGIVYILLSPIESEHDLHQFSASYQKVKKFEPVLNYIDLNYNKKIKVSELAKLLFISESYFATQFSETFKKTPLAFINQRRIEEVKFLLKTTNHTLSRIAIDVGFQDAPHMTRIFKEHFDKTPGRYRRQD